MRIFKQFHLINTDLIEKFKEESLGIQKHKEWKFPISYTFSPTEVNIFRQLFKKRQYSDICTCSELPLLTKTKHVNQIILDLKIIIVI